MSVDVKLPAEEQKLNCDYQTMPLMANGSLNYLAVLV